MSIIHHIRIYHAVLAVLALLAYMTGDDNAVHAWLGYGVAGVIVFRILWAFSGNPSVGLMRFYPSFDGLNLSNAFTHPAITKTFMLGIALSLIAATSTGIMMDRGESIGFAKTEAITSAFADDGGDKREHKEENFLDEALEEIHEFFGNLLLVFVSLHVSYLLMFKRPLAKFMLFLPKKKGQ